MIRNERKTYPEIVINSQRYSFQVYLIPKIGNNQRNAQYAIEFIKYDENNPEDMKYYENAVAFIKEKKVNVSNRGKIKTKEVCNQVKEKLIPYLGDQIKFSPSYHHVICCEEYKIRLTKNSLNIKINNDFCIYDELHGDYS